MDGRGAEAFFIRQALRHASGDSCTCCEGRADELGFLAGQVLASFDNIVVHVGCFGSSGHVPQRLGDVACARGDEFQEAPGRARPLSPGWGQQATHSCDPFEWTPPRSHIRVTARCDMLSLILAKYPPNPELKQFKVRGPTIHKAGSTG